MNDTVTTEQFISLFNIKKSNELENFLSKLDIADSRINPGGHKYKWKPVGDSLSNAANIETATVSIVPIIERIINALDANIELHRMLDSTLTGLPQSPRKAVEKWYNMPLGDTAKFGFEIKEEERTKLASLSKVQFYDSGEVTRPTITIRDVGVGQHPVDFTSTFLRLGKSNKISSPHLHGTYGHGGSSTYRFCDYSIIVSRLHKDTLNGKQDLIGWTIIRKDLSQEIYSEEDQKVVEIKQPPVYQYLCLESGDIPYIVPDGNILFEHGTYVAHIAYDARKWYNLSRGLGYRLFRNYLFDPVLPFRIEDLRPNSDPFNRNMFGARSTLFGSKEVAYFNEVIQYFDDGGKLKIRYWVLFDPTEPGKKPLENYLERENSRDTIILTLNGQRHGTLEKSVISKELRLSNLSDYLLIQIEIDELSRNMKSGLFTSGRQYIVEEGEGITLVREKLKETIEEDEELKEWERKLMIQISKTTDDESKKVVKRILNSLIKIGISPGQGGTQQSQMEGGTGTSMEYSPRDPPTSLRFVTNQDPIEIIQGKTKKLNLEINGPDNLLIRRNDKGRLRHNISTGSGLSLTYNPRDLKNGRLPITLIADDDAELFKLNRIRLILEMDNLKSPLETERGILVISPKIFIPNDPPTEIKFLRNPPIRLYRGKINAISISMNGPNDIFDRQINRAEFSLDFSHPKVHLERIRKPKDGKMSISLKVDEDAEIGDLMNLTCRIRLLNGQEISDSKETIIVESVEREHKHGGLTTVTLPNYDIEPIYREDWERFSPSWNEVTVGLFKVSRDDDGKDKLFLYVNADNENITTEYNRRVNSGQHQLAKTMKDKYIAYMGYHLYQVFEIENENNKEVIEEDSEKEEKRKREMTDEDKQKEYQRVSKTLVLSFQSIIRPSGE